MIKIEWNGIELNYLIVLIIDINFDIRVIYVIFHFIRFVIKIILQELPTYVYAFTDVAIIIIMIV